MSLLKEAEEYADQVLAMIPQLVHKTVEERRKNACWYKARADHRLRTCMPINRWWWRLWRNKHEAACAANREIGAACTVAMAALDKLNNASGNA